MDERESIVEGPHTGVASIVVDSNTGENTIVVAPGANMALSAEDAESSLGALLDGGDAAGGGRDVVLVQLEIAPETALRSLQSASRLGALTILNPAPAPEGWELDDEWYSSIDVLIPNETELASLCGVPNSDDVTGEGEEAMARALLDKGVRQAVVVTLGARGAMIVRRSESDDGAESARTAMIGEPSGLPCSSLPVVDAVGAGDAFCGALAAFLSRGVDLEAASSMACGVASMSVRKRGAQESYPTEEELPDCLRLDRSPGAKDGSMEESVRTKRTITFVTGNKNKLAEVQRLLSAGASGPSIPFEVDNAKLDLPELQGSPEDIAREKCEAASQRLRTAVLTEDTCLCFHALNGLPGPYIKWFLEELGHDGLNKLLDGFDDRQAYARTIVAFSPGPGREVQLFDGRTEGRIVQSRGSGDFGWDAVFEPTREEQGGGGDDDIKTYAEMTKDEKNAISHRGRAFRKFREYLASQSDGVLEEMS